MKTSTSELSDQKENKKKKGWVLVSILTLIFIWYLAAALLSKPYILPGPVETFKAIVQLFKEDYFYEALLGTLGRVVIVVGISSTFGIGLGMLAGRFPTIEYMLSPLVLLVKTIPTIVLIVYVVLWMSGYWAPIFVTVLITFPVIYGNVLEGYREIDSKLMEMASVFKFSRFKKMRHVIFPSVKPYIQSGVLTIGGLGLKVVIASEVLSQTKGSMGRAFQVARINIETQTVLALAIVTVGLALTLEFLSKKMLNRMK